MAGIGAALDRDAEGLQALADAVANDGVMLADAAGENELIDPAENSDKSGDGFLSGKTKHADGKARPGFIHRAMKLAHVAGDAGNTEQAGLIVEKLLELSGVLRPVAKQMENRAGVEIAGTRAHENAARGVSPIVVSTEARLAMAVMLAPLPRCATMRRGRASWPRARSTDSQE